MSNLLDDFDGFSPTQDSDGERWKAQILAAQKQYLPLNNALSLVISVLFTIGFFMAFGFFVTLFLTSFSLQFYIFLFGGGFFFLFACALTVFVQTLRLGAASKLGQVDKVASFSGTIFIATSSFSTPIILLALSLSTYFFWQESRHQHIQIIEQPNFVFPIEEPALPEELLEPPTDLENTLTEEEQAQEQGD